MSFNIELSASIPADATSPSDVTISVTMRSTDIETVIATLLGTAETLLRAAMIEEFMEQGQVTGDVAESLGALNARIGIVDRVVHMPTESPVVLLEQEP